MRIWVAVVLAMTTLAGCAEDQPTDVVAPEAPQSRSALSLDVVFDANATAGTPFNVTLTSPVNITAAWTIELREAQNVTLDDLPPRDGNATGNSTMPNPRNATSGVGLPANVTFYPEAGDLILAVTATADGHEAFEASYPITILAASEDAVDPCTGAAAQETQTFSGTIFGVNGAPGSNDHVFTVGPCQTGFVGSIDYLPTGGDIDVELIDPSGAEVDSAAAFGPTEGDVSAEGSPYLMEGDWTYRVVPFASGPATYDVTITFA